MSTYTFNPADAEGKEPGTEAVEGPVTDVNQLLLYQIKGKPAFAYVDLHLQPSQRVVTDANHMLWMSRRIESPTTECWGGCMDSFGRACAKEACFFNTFTNGSDASATLSVGFNDPGDILSFGVADGQGWILTQGAFIAGTDNLDVRGKCPGCCGCGSGIAAEGMILTHVRVNDEAKEQGKQGVFVAGSYGALVRHDIPQGSVLFVSRGLFFAAHEDTKITIGLAGGVKNLCCSGAALVMKFFGPSVVYTQSRNPDKWNPAKGAPPNKKKNNGGGGGGGDF